MGDDRPADRRREWHPGRRRAPDQPADTIQDIDVVTDVVARWQSGLLATFGFAGDRWVERADGPYLTDKPDWDGYGAVVLLAAYVERPDLAPGTTARRGWRRRDILPVMPREFKP